jgi:hypothetical protein
LVPLALDENGSADEADRRFGEALDLATAAGDYELTLYILNNVTYIAYENDDEAGARTLAECLLTLAEARRLNDRYAAAQLVLDAAFRMCEERGLETLRARAHEEQAALFADTGRFREAYAEHRVFYALRSSLRSGQREARAHAQQAVFEATEARKDSERFLEMAYRDALTGLYNRRYVNEKLPAILDAARTGQRPVSVAIVDLTTSSASTTRCRTVSGTRFSSRWACCSPRPQPTTRPSRRGWVVRNSC